MLGFLKKYEFITSWILLPIEIIFLFFLLKEFKMTRKSFEWQHEEREKSKDEEATMQLKLICQTFYRFVHIMAYDNNYMIMRLDKDKDNIIKQMTNIQTNLDKRVIFKENIERANQEYLDLEKQLKEKNLQQRQLCEELGDVKGLFFKACKQCKEGYLNNLERNELDLIDSLIKHNHFYLDVSSEEELNRIFKDIAQSGVLPDYISRRNIDRKVIENLYYKMFF